MRVPGGFPPGKGEDPAAAMSTALVLVAIYRGLALAGVAKVLLKYG